MSERLTARTSAGAVYLVNVKQDEQAVDCQSRNTAQCIMDSWNRLAAYEDLGTVEELAEIVAAKQDGRLVVLPCKVGDTVYKISYDCTKRIRYNPFDENGYSTAELCLKCDTYPCDIHKTVIPVTVESKDWMWENKAAFGKTVFLTREEAENSLLKGRDNESKQQG